MEAEKGAGPQMGVRLRASTRSLGTVSGTPDEPHTGSCQACEYKKGGRGASLGPRVLCSTREYTNLLPVPPKPQPTLTLLSLT